ncbi:MAG: protein kinase [Eubacteriales bacterium]|jgi:serine/threonine-protein kinase|nr:protein kinase [Eubacteriales bacterium]MDD4709681.1 protein kinase [Eubacteriales bacterium]
MIGKRLADRYEILEKIGEGGMALVYRARDLRTGHDVAVKFLRPEFHDNPEFVSSFHREATAASKMSHHNIVNLLDVGDDEHNLYIVIEHVDGKTLKEIIRERGKLPQDVACQIVIRILSALQHAHAAGIIHRDIKPQNILVDKQGYIKVSDFGIARMVGTRTEIQTEPDKTVMGTVHYFSPEQARGETATAASDLYSAGIVLYELLTGKVPFEGDTPIAIAMQHIQQTPRPIRELNAAISPAVESVVMKALEKAPRERYRTALEMAQAIRLALQFPEKEATKDTPVLAPAMEKSNGIKQRRRVTRQRMLAMFAAVVVLVVLTAGSLAIYDAVVNTTHAPYLVGENQEDAVRLAINAWLRPQIVRQASDEAAGTVILQSHDFGYRMKRDDIILLTVSTGPLDQLTPDMIGFDQTEAENMLERIGLNLLVVERTMNTAPAGQILRQGPEAGVEIAHGGIVQVVISGGQVTVPEVEGFLKDEAIRLMQEAGIPPAKIVVTEVPVADTTQFDRVADQLPAGGSIVMPTDSSLEIVLAVYVAHDRQGSK